MFQPGEDLRFLPVAFGLLRVVQVLLVELLDGHISIQTQISATIDCGKIAVRDLFTDLISHIIRHRHLQSRVSTRLCLLVTSVVGNGSAVSGASRSTVSGAVRPRRKSHRTAEHLRDSRGRAAPKHLTFLYIIATIVSLQSSS